MIILQAASIAAAVAVNAANSSSCHSSNGGKEILAFYIAINLFCIIVWVFYFIKFFITKVENQNIIPYVFMEDFGAMFTYIFIIINAFALFFELVELIYNLL